MMRKFTFTLLMVLVFGTVSFALDTYTASLPTVTASPNENVSMNLNVTDFTSINSFQFYIQIDPAVMTFQNVTNFQTGIGNLNVSSAGGNFITVIWTNTVAHTWANGPLLTLNFKYNGLSCPVAFNPAACEVTRVVGSLPVTLTGSFTDGAISPFMGNTALATIDAVTSPLGVVAVPVKYTGFPTTVGAMTQKISYDPAKLTFISVTGTGTLSSGLNVNASAGVITIIRTATTGIDINYPASQLTLNFSYTTLAATNVSFSTGCVITTNTAANIAVTYYNGSVSPPPVITSYASMPAITTAVQGQMVDVPLTFSGMPAGTNNFNVNLTFDNPRMSFIGIFNSMYPVTSSSTSNSISILYTNAAAPSINGQFLVLRFMYNGIGTANINFASGSQFSNGSPIGVGYTNGSVSPLPATVNANIGFVSGSSPSNVAIPVTFSNIPAGTNIGAVTLKIGFDITKLTYLNATNPFGATIQQIGNVLNIAWSTTTATNLNGIPFITLNFAYAASGNATALVTFKDGCQLASMASPYPIIPANWIDGGVNTLFKLSGVLTYDVPSNVVLDNVTIYIKNGPEPVPPAVTPVPAVLYTTTTNALGYFEINLPNGSYYIYASSTKDWAGVDGGDVTQVRREIAGLSNGIDGSPLRTRSADVSQDSFIDGTDVTALRRRIALLTPNPNYKAPDWIFENPIIVMNGADVNQNFKGLCSGDVNGTYPN
jgi:hypothetical protein